MPQAPRFWPTDPKFRRKFESELHSGCRARNGEFKGSGGLRTPNRAETLFGSVYPPNNAVDTKKCVERGFGYVESEYEVRFGLAHRNGELSLSDPETTAPFNYPFRARNKLIEKYCEKCT